MIFGVRWWHRVRNSHVREVTKQPYAFTLLKKSCLRWLGHVVRMDEARLPTGLCFWDLAGVGGRRRKGGQPLWWRDTCSHDLSDIGMMIRGVKELQMTGKGGVVRLQHWCDRSHGPVARQTDRPWSHIFNLQRPLFTWSVYAYNPEIRFPWAVIF